MKGKLIVIEGIDSCGKATQMRLLFDKLQKEGHRVLSQDFPRYYTSPWGKMIGEFLIDKYGEFEKTDPHLVIPLYMLDQYTWIRDVGGKWLKKGGIILLDRYFTSNVHQVAKVKGKAKKPFRDWMWNLGYEHLKIIKPDIVLVLNVSPEFSRKLLSLKKERQYLNGRKKDKAEKNWKHQWLAYKEYLFMPKYDKSWVLIRCVTRGKLDPPEVIHKRIWQEVSKIL